MFEKNPEPWGTDEMEEDTRLNYVVNPTRLAESMFPLIHPVKVISDDRWNSVKIKRQKPSGLPLRPYLRSREYGRQCFNHAQCRNPRVEFNTELWLDEDTGKEEEVEVFEFRRERFRYKYFSDEEALKVQKGVSA